MPVVRDLIDDILTVSIPMVRHASTKEAEDGLRDAIAPFEREPISPIFIVEMRKRLTILRANLRLLGADMEVSKAKALAPVRDLDLIMSAFQDYFATRSALPVTPTAVPEKPAKKK